MKRLHDIVLKKAFQNKKMHSSKFYRMNFFYAFFLFFIPMQQRWWWKCQR